MAASALKEPNSNAEQGDASIGAPPNGFVSYVAGRVLPGYGRSWHGIAALFLVVPIFAVPVLQTLGVLGKAAGRPWLSYTVTATAAGIILRLHRDYRRAVNGEDAQQARIRLAELAAQRALPVHEFVKVQLKLLVERGRLPIVKAEGRADRLHGVASILACASALAPGLAAIAYVLTDPIPSSASAALRGLINSDGTLPAQLSVAISASRDWRILLAGVSYGFLFLAAAAALYSQSRRQMDTARLLTAEIDHLIRAEACVEIASRADEAPRDSALSRVVTGLLCDLGAPATKSAPGRQAEPEPDQPGLSHASSIVELYKQMRA